MKFIVISFQLFQMLNLAWIGLGVITFFVLLKIQAPYGRHSKSNWGPMINNQLAWVVMELPVLLIVFGLVFIANPARTLPVTIMAALFCAHYIHRSLIFPFRIQTRGKKMPVVIMTSAILFNLCNGFFIGYFFRNFARYEMNWLQDPRFIAGLLIFLTGAWINMQSDTLLIHLRKPGENGYVIPRGFLFDRISCPNHFGEIAEWLGFALLCWNLPAVSFFIWTVANLLPRALAHHRWYKEKFQDYPENRKALIPFLL